MSYPNQYTRSHSTTRRICAAIDEHGPMNIEQLQEMLSLSYFPVRRWALKAVEDGYLFVIRTPVPKGRPRLSFSRVAAELPHPDLATPNPKRRHRRTQPLPPPAWDALSQAFFGMAAA